MRNTVPEPRALTAAEVVQRGGDALRHAPTMRQVRWRRATLYMRRSPVGIAGLILVGIVVLTALLGPAITPHEARKTNLLTRFAPPGTIDANRGLHTLGTDQLGRDVLSRIIEGARVSVVVGILSSLISGVLGVAMGLFAGFYGGWIDNAMMRLTDAFLAIPYLVLVVAVGGILGPGVVTLILILGFTGWVSYCRVVRGEVLTMRQQEFVTAARALGQRDGVLLRRHVLPNVMASIIVLMTLQVATSILSESTLSFLGLGVQPPTVTWGGMLADGRQHIGGAWWLATFPGIAITLTVLGTVFLGDWLRDVLDPKLRV